MRSRKRRKKKGGGSLHQIDKYREGEMFKESILHAETSNILQGNPQHPVTSYK